MNTWKEENPGHEVMDSKEDKEFVEIMTNSLGGMGSDREKNKDKIIKNVLKEVEVVRVCVVDVFCVFKYFLREDSKNIFSTEVII